VPLAVQSNEHRLKILVTQVHNICVKIHETLQEAKTLPWGLLLKTAVVGRNGKYKRELEQRLEVKRVFLLTLCARMGFNDNAVFVCYSI
jgi:hypothetical protein